MKNIKRIYFDTEDLTQEKAELFIEQINQELKNASKTTPLLVEFNKRRGSSEMGKIINIVKQLGCHKHLTVLCDFDYFDFTENLNKLDEMNEVIYFKRLYITLSRLNFDRDKNLLCQYIAKQKYLSEIALANYDGESGEISIDNWLPFIANSIQIILEKKKNYAQFSLTIGNCILTNETIAFILSVLEISKMSLCFRSMYIDSISEIKRQFIKLLSHHNLTAFRLEHSFVYKDLHFDESKEVLLLFYELIFNEIFHNPAVRSLEIDTIGVDHSELYDLFRRIANSHITSLEIIHSKFDEDLSEPSTESIANFVDNLRASKLQYLEIEDDSLQPLPNFRPISQFITQLLCHNKLKETLKNIGNQGKGDTCFWFTPPKRQQEEAIEPFQNKKNKTL